MLLNVTKRLYAIADQSSCLENQISVVDFAKGFFKAGGTILQYRDKLNSSSKIKKNAEMILEEAKRHEAVLILNDHYELAQELGVGFHLGQEDLISQKINTHRFASFSQNELSMKSVEDSFWGLSTHSKAEIETATKKKASYIGFGSVFSSSTKKNLAPNSISLEDVLHLWRKPIVFIGGITLDNFISLPAGPSIYYAVIKDFFRYGAKANDIEKYTREFLRVITLLRR